MTHSVSLSPLAVSSGDDDRMLPNLSLHAIARELGVPVEDVERVATTELACSNDWAGEYPDYDSDAEMVSDHGRRVIIDAFRGDCFW